MRDHGFVRRLLSPKLSATSGFVGWLLALVFLLTTTSLSAATVTWDGGAGTGNWADGANWDTNVAPVAGDDLVFAGSTQLSTTNNIATVDISFNSITFAAAAGAFTLAGSNITLAGNITNSSSNTQAINIPMILDVATCTVTATSGISVGGVVSETGGARALTKAGAGTLYLATNNTYSGTTTVNAGTLQNAILNNTTYGTGGITLNGGTLLVDRVALANNITNSNASSVIIMENGWGSSISGTITNNALLSVQAWYATQTFSGNISGAGGITLTQNAGGKLTLSGTNSYSGATTISSGTLKAGSTSAFGTNSAVTLANVATAILDITGFNNSIGSLAGGGATGGNVTLGTATLTLGGNDTSTSYDGVISGTGAVTKTGAGTQTLTRANTYAGVTTVSAGTLQIGNGGTTGSLSTSSTITVTSPGVLAFNRTNTVTGGTDFQSGIGGTGAVTQAGSGTLIFSGTNTYTGATTISAGTLQIGNGGAAGSLSASSAIINNATLTFNRTDAIAGGADFSNTISGTGAVIQAGTGTVTFSGAASYTGTTTINAGTLILSQVTSFASSTTTVNSPGILELTSTTGTVDNWRINTLLAGAGTINKTGSGWIQTFTNVHTFSGTFNVQVGTFGASYTTSNWANITADFNISVGALLDARAQTITVGSLNGAGSVGTTYGLFPTAVNIGNGNKSGTFSGVINGNNTSGSDNAATPNAGLLSVTKIGSGTQILTGANIYTSATTISAGTLQIGNAGTSGSLSAGSSITNNATLTFNRTNTITGGTDFNNVISGTGAVIQAGSGTVIFAGAQTYTGATTISGGTLKVTATSYATPSFSIATGTVLEFDLSSNANYGATLFFGAGTLRKSGSAAISWQTAAATFQLNSGALIDVVAGTFTGGSFANEVWTSNLSDLTVASGATFASDEANTMVNAINGAGTITSGYSGAGYVKFTYGVDNGSGTFSGVMADEFAPASFCKVGTGTQTLSGINTYTGGTTISAGILIAPVAASLGAGGGVSVTGTLNLTGGANTNYSGINTLSGAGTVNITVGTGADEVDCSTATDWSSFTGTMNIGIGASAGAGHFMIPKPVGSAATINVLTHGTIYTTWRVSNVTYQGTVVLNGGDTGEALGQLRLEVGSTWAGPVILAGTITGAGDGFIGNSTGNTATISGIISETGGARNLSKIGDGTIILSATNTYTGTTTVNAGRLLVTGSTHASSTVTVNSGGTLGGTGTVNGTITMASGGTIAPGLSGVSIGTLFAKTTVMHASSIFSVDLSGASSADLLSALGQTVTCAGTLTVASNASPAVGNTYTIISADTVDAGRFSGLADNAVFVQGGRLYRIVYTSTTVTLTDVAPVISSRETMDVNGNGKLDHIRLTFDQNLNDDFSAITITVAGYTAGTPVTGAVVNDAIIEVPLTELGSADTGATPLVRILSNSSLKDSAGTTLVQVENAPGTAATDKAKPVLLSALYTDGGTNGVSGGDGDTVVLTFSENVTSASMVVGDLTLPVSGDTLITSTIANKSAATPTITVALVGTPLLSPGNTYASGTLGAGKPSGIYLSTATNLSDQATVPNTGLVGTVAADAVDIGASPSSSISIAWNSAGDAVDKTWTLGTAALSTSYVSSTYTVHNIGYSTVALATTSSNSTSATTTWTVQSAVGADQFTMKADASTPLDAAYELSLSTSAITLAPFVRSGTTQDFKLQLSTPTTSSTAAAQAITVTITASQY